MNSDKNKIKGLFDEAPILTDQQALWERIEAELPKEKKKRVAIWWWGSIGVVLLLSMGVWWVTNTNAGTKNEASDIVKSQNPLVENLAVAESKEAIDFNENKKNELVETPIVKHEKSVTEKKETTSTSLTSKKSIAEKTKTETPILTTKTIADRPVFEKENKVKFIEIEKTDKNLKIENTHPLAFLPLKKQVIVSSQLGKNILTNGDVLPIRKLESTSAFIQPVSSEKWSVEVAGGIDFASRKLNAGDVTFKTLKSQFETQENGFSGELILKYQVLPKLKIGAGIQYQRAVERLDWEGIVSVNTSPVLSDSATYFTYQSTNHYQEGELTQTETTYGKIRHYNTINSIHIPVLVNYELLRTGRFSVDLGAGIHINLSNKARGKFLLPDNSIDKSNSDNIFKSSGIHQAMFGISTQYHLNRQWAILMNTQYISALSTNYQSTISMDQRWNQWRLNLGIGLKL